MWIYMKIEEDGNGPLLILGQTKDVDDEKIKGKKIRGKLCPTM